MNAGEIKNTYAELSEQLREALSTMERSDKVFIIRDEIKKLQDICPHESNFSVCPYCGKTLK